MLDRILVLISLGGLVAFCAVIIRFVPEPDLTITIVLMLALATHDFWITVFRPRQPSRLEPGGKLESAPTGVSGKPVAPAETRKAKPKAPRKSPAKAGRSTPTRRSD